jgi:prevent-host-death family protein
MATRAKSYTIANARAHLTDLLNQASYGKERIEVLRRNKPIAYIVSVEDFELLEQIENVIDIKEANARVKETTISMEELRKELSL